MKKYALLLSIMIWHLAAVSWGQPLTPGLKTALAAPTAGNKAQLLQNLLTETKTFIRIHGFRPKSSFYLQGRCLSAAELTAQQKLEKQLASKITRMLADMSKISLDNTTEPMLRELQQLLRTHPNIPSNTTVYAANPYEILEKFQAYIEKYNTRPRFIIYLPGVHYKLLEDMTPQEQEEVRLGRSIWYVLTRPVQEDQQEVIAQIRTLWESYDRMPKAPTLAQLHQRLTDFIAQNGRSPRGFIIKQGVAQTLEQLSPQEMAEVRLSQQIWRAQKRPLPDEPQAQATLHAITQLLQTHRPTAPTIEQLLSELQAWLAEHPGARPRTIIYAQGHYIPIKQLSPGEQDEVKLARRIEHALKKKQEDTDSFKQLKTLWQLPTYQPSL